MGFDTDIDSKVVRVYYNILTVAEATKYECGPTVRYLAYWRVCSFNRIYMPRLKLVILLHTCGGVSREKRVFRIVGKYFYRKIIQYRYYVLHKINIQLFQGFPNKESVKNAVNITLYVVVFLNFLNACLLKSRKARFLF